MYVPYFLALHCELFWFCARFVIHNNLFFFVIFSANLPTKFLVHNFFFVYGDQIFVLIFSFYTSFKRKNRILHRPWSDDSIYKSLMNRWNLLSTWIHYVTWYINHTFVNMMHYYCLLAFKASFKDSFKVMKYHMFRIQDESFIVKASSFFSSIYWDKTIDTS